jgi:hypothetical protein
MCLCGWGLVVDSYVTFWSGIGGIKLCAFLLGAWWLVVLCLCGRALVVGSYVPFREGLVVSSYVSFW